MISLRGKRANVRGRIVLAGKTQVVASNLTPPPKRADDKQLQQRFDPDARPCRPRSDADARSGPKASDQPADRQSSSTSF